MRHNFNEYEGDLSKARAWLSTRRDSPEYGVFELKDGSFIYRRGEDGCVPLTEAEAEWLQEHAVGITHNHPSEGPVVEALAEREGWGEGWQEAGCSLSVSDLQAGLEMGLEYVEAVYMDKVVGVRITRAITPRASRDIGMRLQFMAMARSHDGFFLWDCVDEVRTELSKLGIELYEEEVS